MPGWISAEPKSDNPEIAMLIVAHVELARLVAAALSTKRGPLSRTAAGKLLMDQAALVKRWGAALHSEKCAEQIVTGLEHYASRDFENAATG